MAGNKTINSDLLLSSSFSIEFDDHDSDVQEDVVEKTVVSKKLYWHIMSRLCLLTVLNNLDRANLVRDSRVCHMIISAFSTHRYPTGNLLCSSPARLTREAISGYVLSLKPKEKRYQLQFKDRPDAEAHCRLMLPLK